MIKQERNSSGYKLLDLIGREINEILMKESCNDRFMYLYDTGNYWMAFEKSAFKLCTMYANAAVMPMRIVNVPFPVVAAGLEKRDFDAVTRSLECCYREADRRIYIVDGLPGSRYSKWHRRNVKDLLSDVSLARLAGN